QFVLIAEGVLAVFGVGRRGLCVAARSDERHAALVGALPLGVGGDDDRDVGATRRFLGAQRDRAFVVGNADVGLRGARADARKRGDLFVGVHLRGAVSEDVLPGRRADHGDRVDVFGADRQRPAIAQQHGAAFLGGVGDGTIGRAVVLRDVFRPAGVVEEADCEQLPEDFEYAFFQRGL